MNRVKMSDLHIAMTVNTDAIKRKADIISKHLTAMSEELDLADQLEHDDGELFCSYCRRPVNGNAEVRWPNVYCSKGCVEMAGMEPDARTIRIHRRPDAISIPELADAVIKRLRDYHGLEV